MDTKKATSSHPRAGDIDREEPLVRMDNILSHRATQIDLLPDEDASSCSFAGAASPVKPEIGPVVTDTQMMPQVTRNSTRGRPVAGEVDTHGRHSTQLRVIKKLGVSLKVCPPSGFLLDEGYTSSLAFARAAGSPDWKGFSVEEEERSVRA